MSTILSNRVQKIKPSATLAVSDKAKQLKTQGVQIVSMGSGEPDFDTPVNIQKAATQAIALVRLVTPQSTEHHNSKKPSVRNLKGKTVSITLSTR